MFRKIKTTSESLIHWNYVTLNDFEVFQMWQKTKWDWQT